jgi:undecaprenyl-diphosphatase
MRRPVLTDKASQLMRSRRLAGSEEEADRPVRHPGDLIRVTIGVLVLAASAAVAGQGTAPRFEVDLFRLVNDLPSVLTVPLVVVMQAGTLAAVFVAAGLALAARRWRLARDLAASGTLAWLAAKGVKAFVRRGRARNQAYPRGVTGPDRASPRR